jgi:hypothetical protein
MAIQNPRYIAPHVISSATSRAPWQVTQIELSLGSHSARLRLKGAFLQQRESRW